MPAYMNVPLAKAVVSYDQVYAMEDIEGEFGQTDVGTILGLTGPPP
jgi:NAD(P) transhydrogenase subunit beta